MALARISLALPLTAVLFAGSCISANPPMEKGKGKERKTDASSPLGEIEKWRADRLERLRREDGWLSLVGLFWLKPGENWFGTDRGNRVIFPKGSGPGLMGTLNVAKGVVRVRVNPSVPVTADGRLVRSMVLQSDADGNPTVLRYGSLAFHVIQRGDRLGVRVKDSESPVRRNFKGLDNFPADLSWRLEARLQPYDPPRAMSVPNVLGKPTQEISPGAVVFERGGQTYRLDAVQEEGSTELFIIFGDKTNGHETYGGGRFLYAPRPGPGGKLVVDFNRAYNPPCVFTPYATCPLPPPQNKLSIRVEAGEKTYGEH